MVRAALTLCLVLWAGAAFGHAGLLDRIAALDARIAAAPDDPDLYLKRAELHRLHRDWPAAMADYDRAARLDPDLPMVAYLRGRALFEAGRPDEAIGLLDAYVTHHPDHADARIVRARCRAELGNNAGAVADLDHAIAILASPTPELFIERARLQRPDAAIAGLDDAMKRLGPVVTLIAASIDAHVAANDPVGALDVVDALPGMLAGTPRWQAVRGDLLALSGDPAAADAAYRRALAQIEAMPAARRRTAEIRRLSDDLLFKLSD